MGGNPFFVARAEGCRITDVDGRTYIDFLGSWGPLILGHAAPSLVEAVGEALRRGTSYGAPTEGEVELADLISRAVPSMEMLRLVSSGTEAAMSAIRLARGATGRDAIVKFEGCYHGHADSLLVKAGSGGATFGVPDSLGVPAALAALTITVPFNDLSAVKAVMAARGREVAAIIVEPVAGNMGVVPPARGLSRRAPGALRHPRIAPRLRRGDHGLSCRLWRRPGALRSPPRPHLPRQDHRGRASRGRLRRRAGHHGARGAAGRRLSGGHAVGEPSRGGGGTLGASRLASPGVYPRLEERGAQLQQGLEEGAKAAGVALTVNRVGSMLTAFFTASPVTDYASAKRSDTARYGRFFHAMLDGGVFLAASQFEAAFVSLAHARADLDEASAIAGKAFARAR